jgi:hypothetical protein
MPAAILPPRRDRTSRPMPISEVDEIASNNSAARTN